MGSLEWMQKAITTDFQLRIQAGLNYIATTIINEDSTVTNHSTRMIAARKMLNGQINIPDFSKLVATDSELRTIIDEDSVITDSELLGAIERSLVILAKATL